MIWVDSWVKLSAEVFQRFPYNLYNFTLSSKLHFHISLLSLFLLSSFKWIGWLGLGGNLCAHRFDEHSVRQSDYFVEIWFLATVLNPPRIIIKPQLVLTGVQKID